MKNIHVLPTDKPSRLQKTKHNNFFLANRTGYEYTDCTAQHIYITSDEEIKEGDWFLYQEKLLVRHDGSMNTMLDCKKIILTTDQALIKDGVQAIDDEFLEWFVKNPNCEIEVKPMLSNNGRVFYGYKAFIPKEEPKQESPEEAVNNFKKTDVYINEIKQAQERMYSEEDLISFYNFLENHQLRKYGDVWKRITNDPKKKPLNFESVDDQYIIEWFEQFKKL